MSTAVNVSVLASMAMRGVLTELAVGRATLEAIGGVDAARRVRAGEIVDVIVLADGPMRALEADGFLLPGSLAPVAVSAIAVAVRDGDARPDLADDDVFKRAIQACGRVGYSTGPSGDHLLRLLDRSGLRDTLGDRLVQAPPGVPVGRLLADGAVDLAVQQTSELMGVPGITVVGPLPPEIQVETVFTAGIAATCRTPDAARRFITVLTGRDAIAIKGRYGLGD